MVELKKSQGEVILSQAQLKSLERFQDDFAVLRDKVREAVEDFDNIILRHYFNRENGFLDEQQNNLREVVLLQSRIESLAGRLSGGAIQLKTLMLDLQKDSQGKGKPPEPSAPEVVEEPPSGKGEPPSVPEAEEPSPEKPAKAPQTQAAKASTPGRKTRLVLPSGSKLHDPSVKGGEISIKVFFEELGILRPERREVLRDITRQLHDLLYERKLVGYSKTSLVFGRDKSLGEVLESLGPVFLSEGIRELLASNSLAGPERSLRLACAEDRELVYVCSEEIAD